MNRLKFHITVVTFISIVYVNIFAQAESNLEVVQSLLSKTADEISRIVPSNNSNEIELEFIAADDYKILKAKLIEDLQKNNFVLLNESNNKLNFTLSEVKIVYNNIFRDGILGEYLVERETNINSSFFIESKNEIGKVNNFLFTKLDTVKYDDIKKLENIAFSFTSAEVPSEPFFSSILEPVIAVGTAAVAVYLFFNIRSN
ncbi:MAG: hypothetical protein GY936_17385 [Ignavibacteriae bacterium]|nr:hypothetical protein [Ignavibacteriota bacterium]